MQFDLSKIKARLDGIGDGFAGREAKVGWIDAGNYATGDRLPVATVAAIQEFGSPGGMIPPRPFFRPTIAAKKKEWADLLAQGMRAVVKGKATAEQVLDGVGLQAVGDVSEKLESEDFLPLKPITLMLRKMRDDDPSLVVTGRTVAEAARRVAEGEPGATGGRADPLHDTGFMVATLTHVVCDAE